MVPEHDAARSNRASPRDWLSRAQRIPTNFLRGFLYGTAVMREPITPAKAIAAVQARTKARASLFLETAERAIFAHATSPYRSLLDVAGYDLARVRALVLENGVEEALRRLCQDGVYVSIEEFKGLREARRGSHVFRFGERDFHNPLAWKDSAQPGFRVVSGGTRSTGITSVVSAAEQRMGTEHIAVALAANGLEALPIALWLPQMERSSLSGVMRLAAMRHAPRVWFSQLPGRRLSGEDASHAFFVGISLAGRLRGQTFPLRTYVPFGEESSGLPWVAAQVARNGCAILTIPSAAVRISLAARQRGLRLDGVTFMMGGEPVTAAKAAAIESSGAHARAIFAFTEFGSAAWPCAQPAGPDDMHICRDTVAVVQRRRPADQMGSEIDALLFTSLRPEARRVLLNMETGDYGKITQRRCGCLLEQVGWTEHLEEVRSFEKLNLESWAFLGSKLVALVEETLPARFGGDPTDYQLVEQDEQEGQTRLTVLVHPRLGAIDEAAVLACVESALDVASNWVNARVYRKLKTLQLRRAAPMQTPAGKVMPLHHLGANAAAAVPLAPVTEGARS
jgi:hypothetical protein